MSLNSPLRWSLHIDMLLKCLFLLQKQLTTDTSVSTGGMWVLPPSLPHMREEVTRSHSFFSWPPGMHIPGIDQVWFVAKGVKPKIDPGDARDHACKLLNCQSQTASCCSQATLCPSAPGSVWHQADHLFLTCDSPWRPLVRHRELKRRREVKQTHTSLQSTPSVHSSLTLLYGSQSVQNPDL